MEENKESIEERLYDLSKIIEDSIEGDWTGIIHTKWLEEVRDIIRQVRQDDIKSLIEWAENMKRAPIKVLESQGVKDSQGYDHAFREIIFYLKSQLKELN
jgi:transcriptional regulator of NAD metabolism